MIPYRTPVKPFLAALTLCLTLAADVADFRCFPLTGRAAIREVPNHLFNNPALPPGILADYEGYQLFLIRAANNQKAAFLLLDYKKLLQAPKYLPNMGGFYGTDSAHRPNYVFAKGPFLAGVIGLSEVKADPVARTFAGRIPLQ
jgi:hypothetical protein